MTDTLHQVALAAGATVLGDPDTEQHYLLTAEQLEALVRVLAQPVPPPPY